MVFFWRDLQKWGLNLVWKLAITITTLALNQVKLQEKWERFKSPSSWADVIPWCLGKLLLASSCLQSHLQALLLCCSAIWGWDCQHDPEQQFLSPPQKKQAPWKHCPYPSDQPHVSRSMAASLPCQPALQAPRIQERMHSLTLPGCLLPFACFPWCSYGPFILLSILAAPSGSFYCLLCLMISCVSIKDRHIGGLNNSDLQ